MAGQISLSFVAAAAADHNKQNQHQN